VRRASSGTESIRSRVRADVENHTGIYDIFAKSRADPEVVKAVLELLDRTGTEGPEGETRRRAVHRRRRGEGDEQVPPAFIQPLREISRPRRRPNRERHVKGVLAARRAFIISDAGKIVSAYRYLEPSAEGVDIPKGLGARHMAGGAITRDTNAIAIVLSESDGLVRAFKGGELILEVDPEAY